MVRLASKVVGLSWLLFVLGCGGGESPSGDVQGDSGNADTVADEAAPGDLPLGDMLPGADGETDGAGTVSAEVGPEGATLALPGGGTIEIPAGALDESVTLEFRVIPSPVVEGFVPLGKFHSFEPEGLEFKTAITVTVPFELAEGQAVTPVLLWSNDAGGFDALETVVDDQASTLTGQTLHFSDGGPGGKLACVVDGDCVTVDPCQTGSCDGGNCVFAVAEGKGCDDGDLCTAQDSCGADGVCSGTPLICDDSDACTTDSCVTESGQCANVEVSCDDSNVCTVDTCDAATGCKNDVVADATECDDESACTSGDVCTAGVCAGKTVDCADGNPCTADTCDPATGCVNANEPDGTGCTDGNLCTESDQCLQGTCTGQPVNCDDGEVCTLDQCAPDSGCSNTPVAEVSIAVDDLSLDAKDVVVQGCTLSVAGMHLFQSLTLLEGGVLTHPPASIVGDGELAVAGLHVTVLGDATVDAASAVNVDGRGYAGGQGYSPGLPGKECASGAGHGGSGGMSVLKDVPAGVQTDDLFAPVELGSGGGNKGAGAPGGGGRIRLEVAGTLLNDGKITASAPDSGNAAGGSAGGSIHLTAGTFAGGGEVLAIGGSAPPNYTWCPGGGGGGGRASIETGTLAFTGKLLARGGTSPSGQPGAAGTVVVREGGQPPKLIVDNGFLTGLPTYLEPDDWDPKDAPTLVISGMGEVRPKAPLTLSGLTIVDTGVLRHDPGVNVLELTVDGDAIIEMGGLIALEGYGYGPGQGPGGGKTGPESWGSGGGHAGPGGTANEGVFPAGKSYDSAASPIDMGSGGDPTSGASGGGRVKLDVSGTLTVAGIISANGQMSSPTSTDGAAAGGTVHLIAGKLSGGGLISASGGSASSQYGGNWQPGGGGGGGIVSLWYHENEFSGPIKAYGGTGYPGGGTGMIYRRDLDESKGAITLDADGNPPGPAWLYPDLLADDSPPDLLIQGKASALVTAPFTVGSFHLFAGSTMSHFAAQNVFEITAMGDIAIDFEALIDVSGKGFGPKQGPGAGTSAGGVSSGAGHGGAGGWGGATSPPLVPVIPGGPVYDSLSADELGSGGNAGSGGGRVKLVATGKLRLDGKILAVGQDGAPSAGASSGGSVHLHANVVEGFGHVAATGGTSPEHPNWGDGGGGGGGRIAILYGESNSMLQTAFDVSGGLAFGSATPGSLGTVHFQQVPVNP